jgi:hypothetical protein
VAVLEHDRFPGVTLLSMDITVVPKSHLPEISRETVKALLTDMNRTGF